MTELKDELNTLKQQSTMLGFKLNALKDQRNTALDTALDLQASNNLLRESFNNMVQELTNNRNTLDTVLKDTDRRKAQIAELQRHITEKEHDVEELNTQILQQKERIVDLEAEIDTLLDGPKIKTPKVPTKFKDPEYRTQAQTLEIVKRLLSALLDYDIKREEAQTQEPSVPDLKKLRHLMHNYGTEQLMNLIDQFVDQELQRVD